MLDLNRRKASGDSSRESLVGACKSCGGNGWAARKLAGRPGLEPAPAARVGWEAWTRTSARGERAGIKSRSRVRSVHGGRSSCEGASLAGELAGRGQKLAGGPGLKPAPAASGKEGSRDTECGRFRGGDPRGRVQVLRGKLAGRPRLKPAPAASGQEKVQIRSPVGAWQ